MPEELRRLAFADIRDLFDNDWRLKHPDDLSDEAASILAAVERTTSGKRSTVKVKIQSKLRALEPLARHFALLTDVVRVEDDAKKIALLHAGRARAAAAKAQRGTRAPRGASRPRAVIVRPGPVGVLLAIQP